MFFSISKNSEFNFPNHKQLGVLVCNFDQGWQIHETDDHIFIYKGYCDDFCIGDNLELITATQSPMYPGNFCVISFSVIDLSIKIYTSLYRSFPLYYAPNASVTNLRKQPETMYTDDLIDIDQNLNITRSKFDPIGLIDTTELDEATVTQTIYNLLYKKTENFLRYNKLPIKIFLSGGIDTMLVYSFIKKITDQYELVTGECREFDEFTCKNYQYISENYWGYKQIHHWRSPAVLASGAPGDEFMLRSPVTANLFLMHHGHTVMDLIGQGESLHSKYFLQDKHVKIFKEQLGNADTVALTKNKEILFRQLCNINVNDFQHWHLGNTLTFTPLRDLEIFKLMLRLPVRSAIDQIMNSKLSQELIAINDPDLLNYLSTYKNSENMSNLWSYLDANISKTSGQ